MKLDKEKILAMSPNASAVANAKKICSSGSFVKLVHSSDDTFYMGECKGSGKSNYIVSADFVDEENPIIRCTCPSRQFPCKQNCFQFFCIYAIFSYNFFYFFVSISHVLNFSLKTLSTYILSNFLIFFYKKMSKLNLKYVMNFFIAIDFYLEYNNINIKNKKV